MSKGVVVIGVQWGDEGKGKIVDYYSESADIVARFQGGNNAGHTVVVRNRQTILHLIPSGILQPKPLCLIGSGVVVDPETFLNEIETLRQAGIQSLEKRILLSDRAHLILEYHRLLDGVRENHRSGKIGTTKRGIGPAYEDRAARRGLRVIDLFEHSEFEKKLRDILEEKNFLLTQFYHTDGINVEGCVSKYQNLADKIRPFVRDTSLFLHEQMLADKKILFEGAQGVLLDIDYGTYPFVTSSQTLPSQAALGLGARMPQDTRFVGTMKAYSTRVGEGPFPTELSDDLGTRLRESGSEFGATTGRPRRCGWLDLVAVRYALRISGITHLAMTKADVLSGIKNLKVCMSYTVDGKDLTTFPADTSLLWKTKPNYVELKGWEENIKGVKSFSDLPDNLVKYIRFIERETGAKIILLSTGAAREDVIEIEKVF